MRIMTGCSHVDIFGTHAHPVCNFHLPLHEELGPQTDASTEDSPVSVILSTFVFVSIKLGCTKVGEF